MRQIFRAIPAHDDDRDGWDREHETYYTRVQAEIWTRSRWL